MRPSTRRPKQPGRERPRLPHRARKSADAEPDEREEQKLALTFGRRSAPREHAIATDFGCGACRGVLYVSELGKSGWLSFRCRVGHAFSADSLLLSKEDQLEESLWSTIEVLEELIQLYGVVMLREQVSRDATRSAAFGSRLEVARGHLRTLRGLMDSEGPAPIPTRRRARARK